MLRSVALGCTQRTTHAAARLQAIRLKSSGGRKSSLDISSDDDDMIDKEKRQVKVSDDSCSYGVRKIKEWLKQKDIGYTFRLRRIVDPLVHTGIHIDFPFAMSLSVETHPSVCNSDFAETAIMPTLETIEDPSYVKDIESPRLILLTPLGYSEKDFVLKHKEAEQLFDHILSFRKLLLRGSFVNGIVELPTGETIDMRPPSQIKAAKSKTAVKEQVPIYVRSDYGPG